VFYLKQYQNIYEYPLNWHLKSFTFKKIELLQGFVWYNIVFICKTFVDIVIKTEVNQNVYIFLTIVPNELKFVTIRQ